MREKEFPFRQFRDYGNTPAVLPDISVDQVNSLSTELYRKKLIIVDDLTGSYRYNPLNRSGLYIYTGYYAFTSEMRKIETKPEVPVIDVLLEVEEKSRQVGRIAETLQRSIGYFVFHSLRRERALDVSLRSFSDSYVLRDREKAVHAAESIAEIGHCMLNPHPGSMPPPNSDKAKYTVDLAKSVQDYGLFAANNPEALESTAGYALMLFSFSEQKRRLKAYKPRYDLAVEEFGILQTDIDLSQPLSDDQLFAVKFE